MSFPSSSLYGDAKWKGTQVDHARGWNVSVKNDVKTYSSNKTNGKVGRLPGNYDVTGNFTIYNNTDSDIPFLPGQVGELKLYTDASLFWLINDAIIGDINPEVNIETADIEGFTVNWGFFGADDSDFGQIVAPDGTVIDKDLAGT